MLDTLRMARNPRNFAFAQRLKMALSRYTKTIETPKELALQFNLHYKTGRTISDQAAQKWLSGQSFPTQDKIAVLAEMCQVPELWLSQGINGEHAWAAAETAPTIQENIPLYGALQPDEQQLIHQYRLLSEKQRSLILEMTGQIALAKSLQPINQVS